MNAANVLTTGVFLSGYIVYLKGSDFLTGILNSSVNWASIVALFSFLIFERLRKRKPLLVNLLILSRFLICSVVFLPLLIKNNSAVLNVVLVMVVTGNILIALYNTGFMVWLFGVLPQDSKNEYIYIRTFWLRIAFTSATIVAGFVLDWFHKGYAGFLVVFCSSLIFSILDIVVLVNIKEPEYTTSSGVKPDMAMLLEPIKDGKYRAFLAFIFLFYFTLSISSSFTPLYLIRYLNFSYSFISAINVIAYICMISFTQFWRRVESKKGMNYVFAVTSLIAVIEFLLYSFLTNKTYYLLFLAPVFAGVGYSGFNITILNYRYSLIPDKNRTAYEGWFGAVFGISTLIAPVAGDFIMRHLPVVKNSVYQYSSFQLLYLLSFILVLGVLFLAFFAPNALRLLQGTGQVNDSQTI